ncbi:hypothetical protein PM10SUCC1_32580 [Propionigenium maris DSM 9537]|uniref:Uncharacterized protein n=1 Tax=Propionigenium maris DSM 9537 TaxID=1123000 RepID=A0A9W6GMD2_9FUSO|nr:hypothetical protein [Propionigenium maris]GLI57744.1 hypothetical protein PM10SUCC1_32580 [Propionigenium maris DSM 9537]
MGIKNIKMINIRKKDPKELDAALAEVNSNKLIEGSVKFWESIDRTTGEKEFCYSALSRI